MWGRVIQTITDGKVLAYTLFIIKGGAKRKVNAEEKVGKTKVCGNKKSYNISNCL